jgi:ATP citrate (pro-S)-lyase
MDAQNVASTFKGVIRALREFAPVLIEHDVQIWVRRAGPNYQEGLKNIKAAGQELKLNIKVYGPECMLHPYPLPQTSR